MGVTHNDDKRKEIRLRGMDIQNVDHKMHL